MTTPSALSLAERLMSRAGKTFHLASRLLPESVRDDVVHLYAFCRTVDDLADDTASPLAERQRSLHALAAALEQDGGTDHRSATWPFAADDLLARTAGVLVRAALRDLNQQQPRTEADLLEYAFGVAGTVGIMMAKVLRAKPEGYRAAVALGMGMQLSNISRDVAEDFAAGRVYLPAEWVTSSAVFGALHRRDVADAQRVRAAVVRIVGKADDLYEAAFDGMWSLPWRMRWSILAAAMCYREIGVVVRHAPERSWRQRIAISTGRKLWLVVWAALRLLRPRFWRPQRSPDWQRAIGSAALWQGHLLGVV